MRLKKLRTLSVRYERIIGTLTNLLTESMESWPDGAGLEVLARLSGYVREDGGVRALVDNLSDEELMEITQWGAYGFAILTKSVVDRNIRALEAQDEETEDLEW